MLLRILSQFLLFAILSTTSYSQTIFSEDFEDGTMGGMTIVDNDGLNTSSGTAPFADAWTIPQQVFNDAFDITSNVVISNSRYDPAGTADDWLITPQISVVDANTAVLWSARALSNNSRDGMEVRVSTTNTDLSSFTDVIYSSDAESTVRTTRTKSLNNYIGEQIYIAFINNSTDKYLLLVDDIIVKVLPSENMKISSFDSDPYQEMNQEIPIRITVTNDGGDLLNSLDLKWSDGNNEYTESMTDLNIQTGESKEIVSSTPFVITEAIVHPLNIEISNPNGVADLDISDNSIVANVSGIIYRPSKRVIGEEGTGTWCGFCPSGTVALEYMEANFEDEFIGIAVHNADPMAVSEYDTNLGFESFPNGRINRKFDQSPSEFPLGLDLEISAVTPIAVDILAVGNLDTREIEIEALVESVTQLNDIDYRISIIITEDGVTGTGSGYNQTNYFSGGAYGDLINVNGVNWVDLPDPVLAEDIEYDHVARAILGGFDGLLGSINSNLSAGDMSSQEFSWIVPSNMDMSKLHAIALVIDNATGEILNGAKTSVASSVTSTTEISDLSISTTIYPNPTSQTAYLEINVEQPTDVILEVVNCMGIVITSQSLGKVSDFSQVEYDLSQFTDGIYLLRVLAGDLISTHRLIIAN